MRRAEPDSVRVQYCHDSVEILLSLEKCQMKKGKIPCIIISVALIQKHKIKVCLKCMKVLEKETSEKMKKRFRTNGINNKCMKWRGIFVSIVFQG